MQRKRAVAYEQSKLIHQVIMDIGDAARIFLSNSLVIWEQSKKREREDEMICDIRRVKRGKVHCWWLAK